jgi:hypothetical protein
MLWHDLYGVAIGFDRTIKNKMRKNYIAEARQVYEKYSPEMREAAKREAEALAYPESTDVLNKAKQSDDMERYIVGGAEAGVPGAMLLLARRFVALGLDDEALKWERRAWEHGSAEAAFVLGMRYAGIDKALAYQYLRDAFLRRHIAGTWQLVNFCREITPDEIGVTSVDFESTFAASVALGDQFQFAHAHAALVTGTHPVQFRDELNIPWGTGTFFIVRWKGADFAITAKHVIRASSAETDQVQLVVPYQKHSIPYLSKSGMGVLDPDGEPLDVHVWQIDPDSAVSAEWDAWHLEQHWQPPEALQKDQFVFVVGYPNNEDKIDFDNLEMRRQPLIVKGKLGEKTAGLHTVECAEFSADVDGVSGGPVFSMVGGTYHFIGMAQWGGRTARRLYFLDARQIIRVLDSFLAA